MQNSLRQPDFAPDPDLAPGPHARSPWRVAVAPMMDCTDRHCRYFLRLLAPDVRLYTEMLTAWAIINGDRDRLLGFDPAEHPVAIQLGGSDPGLLARAAVHAASYGYAEINLNVGCPSARVAEGAFGACLLKQPQLVADCVMAMRGATSLPITVKTRIGVDDLDNYDYLSAFIAIVAAAGCRTFVVHARKAMLAGLSPKQNRSVPPLRYEVVYRLKQDFPELVIVINGGVDNLAAVKSHVEHVDGVMIGRKAYAEPYFLTELQTNCLSGPGQRPWQPPGRRAVVEAMHRYAQEERLRGTRLHHITRHMLGLYHGVPGARAWRRYLSQAAADKQATPGILLESLQYVGGQAASRSVVTGPGVMAG